MDACTEEGEVVADRVFGVQFFKSSGEQSNGGPVVGGKGEEPEHPRLPSSMDIQRKDEICRRKERPDPEIDGARSDHPPEIHRQSLARAVGGWPGEVLLQSARRTGDGVHYGLAEILNGLSNVSSSFRK